MLFFHGGMNTQVGSLERLTDPFEKNLDKNRVQLMTEAGYYPMFVKWKSSLWSSYFEHLFYIRQGQRWPWYAGWPSALVIFPVDVTRSIVRAPLVWSMQIYNDIRTWPIFGPRLSDHIAAESTFVFCDVNHTRIERYNLTTSTDDLKFPEFVGSSIEGMATAARQQGERAAPTIVPCR